MSARQHRDRHRGRASRKPQNSPPRTALGRPPGGVLRGRQALPAAIRRQGVEQIAGTRLQRAPLEMERHEHIALDRGIGEARGVAAGKDMTAAVSAGGADRYRQGIEHAAGGTFRGDAAGGEVDLLGRGIAVDEALQILGRFVVAEIGPGACVFLAVDGVVERAHQSRRIGAVVQIGRRRGSLRGRGEGKERQQQSGKRRFGHGWTPGRAVGPRQSSRDCGGPAAPPSKRITASLNWCSRSQPSVFPQFRTEIRCHASSNALAAADAGEIGRPHVAADRRLRAESAVDDLRGAGPLGIARPRPGKQFGEETGHHCPFSFPWGYPGRGGR